MRAMQAAWRNPVYFPNLVVVHWKVKGTALPLTTALWACNLVLLGKMENVRHVLLGTCKQAVYLYWWGVSECPAELCSLYMFSLYFGVVKCHCCDVALFGEMVLMNIQKILMKVAK